MLMSLDHTFLKDRQRREREGHPASIAVRIHRALSWLNRAESCQEDDDARFIFLWIAFNAAYANEIDEYGRFTEQDLFRNFIKRLVTLDNDRVLYEMVWTEFSSSIRVLLDNQFVFGPFWQFQNKKITEQEWKTKFANSNAVANKALGTHNTERVLTIIFARLYVLRNQLVHGGATWNSRVNRAQVRDGANILGKLVPYIIQILLDNPNELWGEACYPVVDA